jgi:RNA polymerase-binding protein DksA
MLPALPVEATSAREADMAGARRGTTPAAGKTRGAARPSQSRTAGAKAPAAKSPAKSRAASPASRGPATKGAGAKPGRTAAGRGKPGKTAGDGGAAAGRDERDRAPQATAAELPVREGEHRWTQDELAEVRAGLQEQIEGLRTEIAASASQIAEGDSSDGAGDDQADAGAKTYEREHELALSYNSQDLLAQMERAVQRMDAGTYGICESCARPIGKARLQVFPRATLCVTCKQREERR